MRRRPPADPEEDEAAPWDPEAPGALRRRVQVLLSRLPCVLDSHAAAESDGGWGATWVRLRPAQESQK